MTTRYEALIEICKRLSPRDLRSARKILEILLEQKENGGKTRPPRRPEKPRGGQDEAEQA